MDEIAEDFGVLDWHERTVDRYEQERLGSREVQRQRAQRPEEVVADPFDGSAGVRSSGGDWWKLDPFTIRPVVERPDYIPEELWLQPMLMSTPGPKLDPFQDTV